MSVHVHFTNGYDNCQQLIKMLSNLNDVILLLFLAAKETNGERWNEASNECAAIVDTMLTSWEPNRRVDIIVLEVGYSEWQDMANEFKLDEEFAIFNLPTLKRWGKPGALVGQDCAEDFLVREFFEINSNQNQPSSW